MLRARELRMHRWTKSAGTAVDPSRSGRVLRAAKNSSPESLFSPWPEKCSSTRSSDWLSANRSLFGNAQNRCGGEFVQAADADSQK